MLPCIERIVNDNTNAFSFPQLYIKWTPPPYQVKLLQNSIQLNVITQNPVIWVVLKNKFVFKILINLIKPAKFRMDNIASFSSIVWTLGHVGNVFILPSCLI